MLGIQAIRRLGAGKAASLVLSGAMLAVTAVAGPAGAGIAPNPHLANSTPLASAVPESATTEAKQWSDQGFVFRAEGREYCLDLFNDKANKELSYGKRKYGINLVWAEDGDSFCFSKKNDPILFGLTYGEPFAMKNKTGGYVKYGVRDYGINLVWSKTASYEWYVIGGTPHTIVGSQDHFALWNKTTGQFLVYGSRSYGINLVWSS